MISTNPMEISVMQTKATLPAEGYVRLSQIIGPTGPIPISRSSWWAGVKSGRYPQPLKLGPRTTVWRVEQIRELIAQPTADGQE
jgi:prophage regulatory protein